MNLSSVSSMVLDCVIVATALMLIYRALRWLLTLIEDRWIPTPTTHDPAAVAVWEVLAEARRITEGDH